MGAPCVGGEIVGERDLGAIAGVGRGALLFMGLLLALVIASRGGHCLRAPAQGACPYANICEHCPNFVTDTASIAVLSAQRIDTAALADDAEQRGWIDEAGRHRKLLDRLDTLIAQTG